MHRRLTKTKITNINNVALYICIATHITNIEIEDANMSKNFCFLFYIHIKVKIELFKMLFIFFVEQIKVSNLCR